MEAAQQQNRNPDSLIRNITEALFSDKLNIEERDAVRLANELSIGPPDSVSVPSDCVGLKDRE